MVGPDEWTDIFLEAGYYEQTWLQLGSAFANWANTHSAAARHDLVTLYQSTDTPGNDNEFAVYNAVQCTDVQWPTSWAVWSKDNTAVNKIAPFETWANAWFNAPCLYWPAPAAAAGPDRRSTATAIRSALLIDETLDAATPFPGSLEVRKLFPHSVLLAEPGGTTHADSLSGNLCVDDTIASYLETGKLPPRKPERQVGQDLQAAAPAGAVGQQQQLAGRGPGAHSRAAQLAGPSAGPRRASQPEQAGRPVGRSGDDGRHPR